jgi:pyruvate/2-oxoglutarate dehydrogenase complex dihydrolipoamide acyltransferase (E2) component
MPDFDLQRIDEDDTEAVEQAKANGWEVFDNIGGTLRLRRPVGYKPDESAEEPSGEPADELDKAEPIESPAFGTEPDATDAARELADAEGVDLSDVDGTGERGRILKSDVESHLNS